MKPVSLALVASFSLIAAGAAHADVPWTPLSLSACQVDAYLKAHPEIDGRGVVVAVMDTGVEIRVPGLTQTSTGETKVVDVQDFSGEGDIDLVRAKFNEAGDKILHYGSDDKPEYYGLPKAGLRPDGTTLWFGTLEEKTFRNSAVRDINDNGQRDDVFGVCVIVQDNGTDDDAVCLVDTDADRDFSDETPLKNYKLSYDSFVFPRDKAEDQLEPLTMAVNIFTKQQKVVLHFDDGGHGTHVAGIATGYRIQGQDGFNGVAPGAKVISLKIGNNKLAGGATTTGSIKRALQYAGEYAREHDCIVVCNLSYGIGSALEGQSSIDGFVDSFLRTHPNVVFCTSAGNEGPGLSSVGTPAAAPAAISVGALWAADTARDMNGMQQDDVQLTEFSSRGGEMDKPDIATPGMETSTVPLWNHGGDFWGGTSMASPYAAGMCALLANHVQATHQIQPRSDWIKLAIKRGARPIPGFCTLDYGAGVPEMPKAADAIDRIVKNNADDPLFAYSISTESPIAAGGKGATAYWRTTFFPKDRPQSFTVKPLFVPTADAKTINAFSKRLMLRCDAPWCKLLQDQIYFRDQQSATVRVEYDPSALKEPGLYTATVEGLENDEVSLRLVNSIIVPHRFNADNNYELKLENQRLDGMKVNRHYFAVPAGATAMHIKAEAIDGKPCTIRARHYHNPEGVYISTWYPLRLDTRNERIKDEHTVGADELRPGIWELPLVNSQTDQVSYYNLTVRFDGVSAEPAEVSDLSTSAGSTAGGSVTLTNVFERPATVSVRGKIEGYRKTLTKKATTEDDVINVPMTLNSEIKGVRVRVETSAKDYLQVTDCATTIFDGSGKALEQDGMSDPFVAMYCENPDPSADSTSLKLEVMPAFTHPNQDQEMSFDITIDYLYAEPIDVSVDRGGATQFTLYPGIPTEIDWSADATIPAAPDGTQTLGYIRAKERTTGQDVIDIKILGEE